MADIWTYADWVTQTTRALRVSRLRSHISEVSQQIDADMATGGQSFRATELREYHKTLLGELNRLDPDQSGSISNGARARSAFTSMRPVRP